MNSDDTKRFEWNVSENWPNALFMDDAFESAKMVEYKKSPFVQTLDHCKHAYKMLNIISTNLYAMIREVTHTHTKRVPLSSESSVIWFEKLHFIKAMTKLYRNIILIVINTMHGICSDSKASSKGEQKARERKEKSRSISTARTQWLYSRNRLSCLDACEICFTHTKSIFWLVFCRTTHPTVITTFAITFNVSLYSLILFIGRIKVVAAATAAAAWCCYYCCSWFLWT